MRAPYPTITLSFYALNAVAIAYIALYRAELYRLPAPAWLLCAALGLVGLTAPAFLASHVRARLLAGAWPLALVLPLLALLLGPGLVPSPLTVGPFLFCAGASLATCVVAWRNAARRRRRVRRLLEDCALADRVLVRAQFVGYLASERPMVEEDLRMAKRLHRVLRAQAWCPTAGRRSRAATVLREWAGRLDAVWRALDARVPAEPLRELVEASRTADEQVGAAIQREADRLETGGRRFRWRTWLTALGSSALDAERDLYDAVDLLAKRLGVPRPSWLRRVRRRLGCLPFTQTDVAPRWSVGRLARPATVLLAGLVFTSALAATATARDPREAKPSLPHDRRALPVIEGPSVKSRIEPRFSRAASTLAGRRAEVRCWSRDDWRKIAAEWVRWPNASQLSAWSGFTSSDGKRINIAPAPCAALARLAYGDVPARQDRWPAALALSAAILAHEAQHVRGFLNEAVAECFGLQSITDVTRALGRTEEEGAYLASLFWLDAYPKHEGSRYHSPECRNGGRLDRHPASDVWP